MEVSTAGLEVKGGGGRFVEEMEVVNKENFYKLKVDYLIGSMFEYGKFGAA